MPGIMEVVDQKEETQRRRGVPTLKCHMVHGHIHALLIDGKLMSAGGAHAAVSTV